MPREKIEERTALSLPFAEMNVYETNIPCSGFPFFFRKPVVTMMLNGSKQVKCGAEVLHFDAASVLIPERDKELSIDIVSPSYESPTKCVVLDIEQSFVGNMFAEIKEQWHPEWKDWDLHQHKELVPQFITSDPNLYQSLSKLYQNRVQEPDKNKADFLYTLNLKELIYLLLRSEAKSLLFTANTVPFDAAGLQAVVDFIKANLHLPITIKQLARIACMSEASLFLKFKSNYDCSPMEYIISQRIALAKKLLREQTSLGIQEVCFESGFNTIEYFYRKFRQTTGFSPKEYRDQASIAS